MLSTPSGENVLPFVSIYWVAFYNIFIFNPFFPNTFFLYLLRTSENLTVTWNGVSNQEASVTFGGSIFADPLKNWREFELQRNILWIRSICLFYNKYSMHFFISMNLISIFQLRCLKKNKHILSIFSSLNFFNRFHFFPNQLYRIVSHKQILTNIRIKLILKRPLQCSCQTQLNVQIWTYERDYCSVHIKRNIRPWNGFRN